MSEAIRPGAVLGPYPERKEAASRFLERVFSDIARHSQAMLRPAKSKTKSVVRRVEQFGKTIDALSAVELNAEIDALRHHLLGKGLTEEMIVRSFTIIRTMSDRILGLRHYDVQLMGGWIMLKGMLAEMETGEGKTLAATLPACTAALAGIPVHIITVNDYLATRDAERMGPLYRAFGLSVGVVTEAMGEQARRAAYACDITYCTNKQVAFDYLRDRINRGGESGALRLQLDRLRDSDTGQQPLFLRGLCFAIVDEADSVLIDEARTPLIISRTRVGSDKEQAYRQALDIASALQKGADFQCYLQLNAMELTEKGQDAVAVLSSDYGGIWQGKRRRESLVLQALKAQQFYLLDTHYLVQDDKIQIIDEHTGRRMPDRSWEHGLHQMIEVKEGCEISGERETLARISYQCFFRRYLRLSGMTGTAQEVKSEVQAVYGVDVVTVPTHRPGQRVNAGYRVFQNAQAKWDAVVNRIGVLHQQGRPVLVGTRSVYASELLSRYLSRASLPHQVLNARQDKFEADIVRRAGETGQITVATNMAGRGTDICLGAGVKGQGGLHVIATELNDARRIDRQLFGRSGRQGDPGSFEVMLDLEDPLLVKFYPEIVLQTAGLLVNRDGMLRRFVARFLVRIPQYSTERQHRKMRHQLLHMDERLDDLLAFTGARE